uniref:Virion component n=1 Tax=Staphylococcus phage UHP46 TaxID=3234966 RepID=A0AB39C817_9CAUD
MTIKTINDIISNVDLTTKSMDENKLFFYTGKFFSMEDVIDNLDKYNVVYEQVYKSYGFNNFYDMFIYADSNTDKVYKGGNKELSKLNKVKRKVMRNGKMIEMTVYEANGNEEEGKDKQPSSEDTSAPRSAIGAKPKDNGNGDTKVNPKKLATTLGQLKNSGANIENVRQDADMYREYTDENGETIGLSVFKEDDNTITLEGFTGAEDVTGLGIRSVMELIKLGIQKEKGIIVEGIDSVEAEEFLKTLGFKKTQEVYKMSKKDVKGFIGDYGDFL